MTGWQGDWGITFCYDRILTAFYPPPKADDTYNARSVPFKVLDIVIGTSQQLIRDNAALVVLKAAILPYLLDTDRMVHQSPVYTPPFALLRGRGVHVDEVGLPRPYFREDQHSRAGRVHASSLLKEV